MEARQVVTIFLECQGKVMIVRRSEQVGSYPGYWSGISGYLEGNPLDHAMVELREETGLVSQELTLIRQADPLEIMDAIKGVLWRIHPFLFAIQEPTRICLDWENVEYRWILPEELPQFQTVPSLEIAMAACLGRAIPGGSAD